MESSEAIGSKRRIKDHLNIENTNCQSYDLSADASDGKELGKASQRNKKPVVIIKKYMLAYRLEREATIISLTLPIFHLLKAVILTKGLTLMVESIFNFRHGKRKEKADFAN
jgi:hypothetical protein